jgi:hypothetical protein
MSELVTVEDLARARSDGEFRQQMLANNLERLLEALKRMRKRNDTSPQSVRQIREGVDLAVKLADRLQESVHSPDPRAA